MAIDLQPNQVGQLAVAIYSAFETTALKQILLALNEDLDSIDFGGAHQDVCLRIATRFQKQSRADDLVRTLVEYNPGNLKLKRFALAISLVSPTAPTERFEAVLSANYPERLPNWRDRMDQAGRSVGRVEIPESVAAGTGFLIAPDLLLTNWHVAKKIELLPAGRRSGLRLGYDKESAAGSFLAFHTEWRAAWSPEQELDFALIRLAAPTDLPHLTGQPLDLKSREAAIILQHPAGRDLRIAVGTVDNVGGPPPRVQYTVDTDYGTSGSPVFTGSWDLAALHRAGGDTSNQGVPLSSIWERIASHLNGACKKLPAPSPAEHRFPGPGPVNRPASDPGLDLLAGQMQNHVAVREAVTIFRFQFQDAYAKLASTGQIKKLHDILHDLSLKFALQLPSCLSQFPASAKTTLTSLVRLAERKLDEAKQLAGRPALADVAPGILEELASIIDLVRKAIQELSADALRQADYQLRRLLGTAMPGLERLISDAAGTLPLQNLAGHLRTIRTRGVGPRELEETIRLLLDLDRVLRNLVERHRSWQRIDGDLRLMAREVYSSSSGDLETIWKLLIPKLEERSKEALQSAGQTVWAKQLAEAIPALQASIAAKNLNQVASDFLDVQALAGERFKQVDGELLEECERLVPISAGVDLVLKEMA